MKFNSNEPHNIINTGHSCCGFNSITSDGNSYYMLSSVSPSILVLDLCFKEISRITTSRKYSNICFDFCNNCFWAIANNHIKNLYKLDCNFNELEIINIPCNKLLDDKIESITCNFIEDSLIISTSTIIYSLSILTFKTKIIRIIKNGCIKSLSAKNNLLVVYYISNDKQYIIIFNENNDIISKCKLSCKSNINSITIDTFYKYKNKLCLVILINSKKDCLPKLRRYCIDICDKHCLEDDLTDVISSIALIETAISHIINAEGEKIQKVLSCSDNIEEILCVNKEVNNTIINITHLEQILYQKLSIALECLKDNNYE